MKTIKTVKAGGCCGKTTPTKKVGNHSYPSQMPKTAKLQCKTSGCVNPDDMQHN